MKILLICSKRFYKRIPEIKEKLEFNKHQVFLPNCYDAPDTEDKMRNLGRVEHSTFKAKMFRQSEELISQMDAVLVLNYDKDDQKNYVGGATFLEMYDAFRFNKEIYMLNDIPSGILKDEIIGFNPIILHNNITDLK